MVTDSTRKSSATTKKSSATGKKPSATGQRTLGQPSARNDLWLRPLVARSKDTVERCIGGVEQELEKRRQLRVPIVDATLTLPPPDKATFYVGLGALAAVELIEWPVAMVVGVGHYLATRSRSTAGKELGQAAESA
jgi:hypothetical protein